MRQGPALLIIGVVLLGAVSITANARAGQNSQAGWGVMNCNGHTHIVYAPTWLKPTKQMTNIMIMDRDHDNYTPLKLTVNSITETSGASCAQSSDYSFPTTIATNPIGGVVTTVVQVLAAKCKGTAAPRVYDINITCEHDGENGTGTGVYPAIGNLDLLVTVGGKRPQVQAPANPTED